MAAGFLGFVEEVIRERGGINQVLAMFRGMREVSVVTTSFRDMRLTCAPWAKGID